MLMADRAYAELRDRIVTLQIPPGAPIGEEAVARDLQMGRTPVREAVKRLELESLVTVFRSRGTFASKVSISDLGDISDLRQQLEGHAAVLAAQRITNAQLADLQGLLHELSAVPEDPDGKALIALDARVHDFVYRCAGNGHLEQTLARYFNLSRRMWHLVLDRMPDPPTDLDEHRRLLEAIRAHDTERARQELADHIAIFERALREVL